MEKKKTQAGKKPAAGKALVAQETSLAVRDVSLVAGGELAVVKKVPWYNAANIVTFARFAFMPIIAVFYLLPDGCLGGYGKLVALVLFVIAAATDFLDGWIARRFNLVTDMGKLLDPIADKTLTFLGFLLIFTDVALLGTLYPVWFAVVVFFVITLRDNLINAVRQLSALKGTAVAAGWVAKWKSTFHYIGISLAMFYAFASTHLGYYGYNFMFGDVARTLAINPWRDNWSPVIIWGVWVFLGISVLLSLISGVGYIVRYIKANKAR